MDISNVSWPGWEVVRVIGHGSFGAVYEIERDTFGHKEQAALKVITIPQNASDIDELYSDGYDAESITMRFQNYLEDIVHEYSVMVDMKGHTNVVYCDDLRYVQHDDGIGWDIYIKMELLTPLTRVLGKKISDEQVIRIGMDICSALMLCRDRNIVHRDIKPQNIFVSKDGNYKLGDFGIAKTAERTTSGTKVGTYKYMAPEVYNNQPYGAAADIYSLGLVMYWLLNERRTPFLILPPKSPGFAEEELARKRRFEGEVIPAPAHGSAELQAIVLKACAFDPKDRYASAQEMYEALVGLGTVNNAELYGILYAEEDDDPVDLDPEGQEPLTDDETETADLPNTGEDSDQAEEDGTETIGAFGVVKADDNPAESAEDDQTSGQPSEEEDGTVGAFSKQKESSTPPAAPTPPVQTYSTPIQHTPAHKDTSDNKKKIWIILVAIFCSLAVIIGVVLGVKFVKYARIRQEQDIARLREEDKMVVMPKVVGEKEQDAKLALEEAGLKVTVKHKYSADTKLNRVISQDVSDGDKVEKGTTVTLVVCSMDGMVKTQNVVDMKATEAKKALEEQGWKVTIKKIKSKDKKKGIVLEQEPKAGSVEKEGSTIVLTVGKGAETDTSQKPTDTKPQTETATKPTDTKPQTDTTTTEPQTTTQKDPGPWSDWSKELPSGVTSSMYDIEKKVQYRYRDKETTSSKNSSMSGWTQTGSSYEWSDYGSWSGWSTSPVSSSSSREVETKPLYRYYYFRCPSCGRHEPFYTVSSGTRSDCGATIPQSAWVSCWSTVPYSQCGYKRFNYTSIKYYTTSLGDGEVWIFSSGNLYNTAIGTQDAAGGGDVIVKGYRYRDRSKITTYYYERWGSWSSWSGNSASGGDNRQVQTRTVYRYRTKGS